MHLIIQYKYMYRPILHSSLINPSYVVDIFYSSNYLVPVRYNFGQWTINFVYTVYHEVQFMGRSIFNYILCENSAVKIYTHLSIHIKAHILEWKYRTHCTLAVAFRNNNYKRVVLYIKVWKSTLQKGKLRKKLKYSRNTCCLLTSQTLKERHAKQSIIFITIINYNFVIMMQKISF